MRLSQKRDGFFVQSRHRFLAVVSKSVRTYGFVSSWNDHCELKFIQSPLQRKF